MTDDELDDEGVATARWVGAARDDRAQDARLAAVGFAERHGMTADATGDVDDAIDRAVHALGGAALSLEVATDDEWLTVLLRAPTWAGGPGSERDEVAATLGLLCDRLEMDAPLGGGAYVLMEFRMPEGERPVAGRSGRVVADRHGP